MKPNRIMPSRAFCSDENQGYPIILIAKHFGSFPFNHGRVGVIVVTTGTVHTHTTAARTWSSYRRAMSAMKPDTGVFGVYRRLQTENHEHSTDCGAICNVMNWYQNEFNFACQHITLKHNSNVYVVIIDNQLLVDERNEGLFLNLGRTIDMRDGHFEPLNMVV